MPPLLQLLRKPHSWLGLLLLLAALSVADANRAPNAQLTVRVYIAAVRLYQQHGRPFLSGYVQCRFLPSCSEYSIAVVRQYGIKMGFLATARRLRSCTPHVQMGTYDPVR